MMTSSKTYSTFQHSFLIILICVLLIPVIFFCSDNIIFTVNDKKTAPKTIFTFTQSKVKCI